MYMERPQRKRIKYLNNADLLREIHIAKMSYSYVLSEQYSEYDIIVDDIRKIDADVLELAHTTRIARLKAKALRIIQKERNCTPKQAREYMCQDAWHEIENTLPDDVVIRVLTAEHIPHEDDAPIRTNFKPFKQYSPGAHGELVEVARSHWKGDLQRGEFCMDHGSLPNELGRMFIVLCEKIGMQPNYRGYSFLDEMKGDAQFQLAKNALLFDEGRVAIEYGRQSPDGPKEWYIPKIQLNPFAYYTTIVNHAFKAVLNSEKKNREIRDDLLEESGYDPSNTRIVEYELRMIQQYQERLAEKAVKKDETSHGGMFDWGGE